MKKSHRKPALIPLSRPNATVMPQAIAWTAYRWRDQISGTDLLEVRFPAAGGGEGSALFPISVVDARQRLIAGLRDNGALLPMDQQSRDAIIGGILAAIPDEPGLQAGRSGWHDNVFLYAEDPINGAANKIRLRDDIALKVSELGVTGGTLSRWQAKVARPAAKSTYVSFAIAAALAAPISGFAELDEGAVFNFHSKSSTGKTTALLAALSVAGKAKKLPDWNASGRALHERSAAHSDLPMVLDDLERFRADEGGRVRSLSNRLHTITGGRSSSLSTVVRDSLPELEWFAWVLSSGPLSLREEFERERLEPSLGDERRWIDIKVPPEESGGIWDRVTPGETPRQLAERSEAVKSACRSNYGIPMKRWLRHLTANYTTISGEVRAHVDQYVALACPRASGPERSIARKFGAVYAAGQIAVQIGLLPWTPAFVLDVCRDLRASNALTASRRDVAVSQARSALKAAVIDRQRVPVLGSGQPSFLSDDSFDGFRQVRNGVEVLFLRWETIDRVCGAASEKILRDLRDAGALRGGQGGKKTLQVRLMLNGQESKLRFLAFDPHLFAAALSPQAPGVQ